jgi:hypothetical protein
MIHSTGGCTTIGFDRNSEGRAAKVTIANALSTDTTPMTTIHMSDIVCHDASSHRSAAGLEAMPHDDELPAPNRFLTLARQIRNLPVIRGRRCRTPHSGIPRQIGRSRIDAPNRDRHHFATPLQPSDDRVGSGFAV